MDARGYGVTTPGRTFVDIAAVAMQLLGFPFVHDALDHQGLEEPPMAVTQGQGCKTYSIYNTYTHHEAIQL